MRVGDWLDERTGHRKLVRAALDEPILGGARWAYVFGSALAFLVVLQAATGITLATYYSPSSREAWGSVHYVTHEVPFAGFVRGLHHWGAHAMVVLLVAHMFQVFLYGAYRRPREVTWWSGLALLAVTLAFSLTGYLLPWDQKGYWATRVVTSLIGALPGIGRGLQRMVQGGDDFGTLTLTRFYAFHVFILPAALLAIVGVHLMLFRRHGVTPSPARPATELETKTEPFWPRQVGYDMAFSALVLAVIVALVRIEGVPLAAPADPSSNYPARPEWYFLWLFELLKFFPGKYEAVGVVVFAALAALFLAALPFVDRGERRGLRARWPFVVGGFGIALAIGALTAVPMLQDKRNPAFEAQRREAEENARRSFALAKLGIPPGGTEELYLNDPREHGKRLFAEQCAACHKIGGVGGEGGPDLGGYLTRGWMRGVIADPGSALYYGPAQAGLHPQDLAPADVDRLAGYVLSLGGHASAQPADADLFDESGCGACHATGGASPKLGPTLDGLGTRAWVRDVIRTPGAPAFFGESNKMPSFEARLSDVQLDDLLTYLLSLGDASNGGGS